MERDNTTAQMMDKSQAEEDEDTVMAELDILEKIRDDGASVHHHQLSSLGRGQRDGGSGVAGGLRVGMLEGARGAGRSRSVTERERGAHSSRDGSSSRRQQSKLPVVEVEEGAHNMNSAAGTAQYSSHHLEPPTLMGARAGGEGQSVVNVPRVEEISVAPSNGVGLLVTLTVNEDELRMFLETSSVNVTAAEPVTVVATATGTVINVVNTNNNAINTSNANNNNNTSTSTGSSLQERLSPNSATRHSPMNTLNQPLSPHHSSRTLSTTVEVLLSCVRVSLDCFISHDYEYGSSVVAAASGRTQNFFVPSSKNTTTTTTTAGNANVCYATVNNGHLSSSLSPIVIAHGNAVSASNMGGHALWDSTEGGVGGGGEELTHLSTPLPPVQQQQQYHRATAISLPLPSSFSQQSSSANPPSFGQANASGQGLLTPAPFIFPSIVSSLSARSLAAMLALYRTIPRNGCKIISIDGEKVSSSADLKHILLRHGSEQDVVVIGYIYVSASNFTHQQQQQALLYSASFERALPPNSSAPLSGSTRNPNNNDMSMSFTLGGASGSQSKEGGGGGRMHLAVASNTAIPSPPLGPLGSAVSLAAPSANTPRKDESPTGVNKDGPSSVEVKDSTAAGDTAINLGEGIAQQPAQPEGDAGPATLMSSENAYPHKVIANANSSQTFMRSSFGGTDGGDSASQQLDRSPLDVLNSAIDRVTFGKCIIILYHQPPPPLRIVEEIARQRGAHITLMDLGVTIHRRPRRKEAKRAMRAALDLGDWLVISNATKSIATIACLEEVLEELTAANSAANAAAPARDREELSSPQLGNHQPSESAAAINWAQRTARVIIVTEPHPHFPKALLSSGNIVFRHSDGASYRDGSGGHSHSRETLRESMARLKLLKASQAMMSSSQAANDLPEMRKVRISTNVDVVSYDHSLDHSVLIEESGGGQQGGNSSAPPEVRPECVSLQGEQFTCLEMAGDGRIAAGSSGGNVYIYSVKGSSLLTFHAHQCTVWGLDFRGHHEFVLGSEDACLSHWSHDIFANAPGYRGQVITRFSSDVLAVRYVDPLRSDVAVAGGLNGSLCFVNVSTGKRLVVPTVSTILCLNRVPHKPHQMLMGGGTGLVTLWDCDRGVPSGSFFHHRQKVSCVAAYNDILVSSSFDGSVALVDMRVKTISCRFSPGGQQGGPVACFAQKGNTLAVAAEDSLCVYDLRKPPQMLHLRQNAWHSGHFARGLVIDDTEGYPIAIAASSDGFLRFFGCMGN